MGNFEGCEEGSVGEEKRGEERGKGRVERGERDEGGGIFRDGGRGIGRSGGARVDV